MKIDPVEASTLPKWLVNMARHDGFRRVDLEEQFITVTSLLQPTNIVRLTDRYWDEIEFGIVDSIPALLGQAWHDEAAKHDPSEGSSELRMEVEFDGWRISGQPDYFGETKVIDRKTSKVWSRVFGKPEWTEQLNVYRWLISQALQDRHIPSELEVHVVYVDWTENVAKRGKEYPQSRFEVIPVDVWPLDLTEAFIRSKLAALEAREFSLCSPQERWERGECYAVMKPGRKSAVKLCETMEDADFIANNVPGGTVVHREGDPVRCRSWCDVKEFCPFGRTLADRDAVRPDNP